MLLDRIDRIKEFAALCPRLKAAGEWLEKTDLYALENGRHDIDGDVLFAVVQRGPARSAAEGRLEAHKNYIDIQVLLSGEERLGWQLTSECSRVSEDYDPERDLIFYEDAPVCWADLTPGHAAVFFPEDAHLPMVGEGQIHKMVVKVAVP